MTSGKNESAYNMQYTETRDFAFTMKVQGTGKTCCIGCWNGDVREVG